MNIKIFNDKLTQNPTPILRLLTHGGRVTLCAVDAAGKRLESGSILSFNKDGSLYLHIGLTSRAGLPINAATGQVKTERHSS